MSPIKFLIVDATESSEPMLYYVDGASAPGHLKRHLRNNPELLEFEFVVDDGADGMMGLVDPDSDSAEERAEEVMEWLRDVANPKNKYKPGGRMIATHYISIAAA